jgi:hypothetical protein
LLSIRASRFFSPASFGSSSLADRRRNRVA